ncbi:porin [Ramlibacter sp. AW1]|uniref:Porin n=1 Tax=Ramlibacter aurantiacus TaxID=2801330 RepID=A0A937D3S5_9BURK|nr:porin [Ramlibacter aurantiacus]MBL0419632.1 porin [Ramlibacter aurantiacus]
MHTKILRYAAGLLCFAALEAHAQFDHSFYGVLDLSYGRFERSGFYREHRFNSNSLSASFVGVNATYGLEGGWTPGMTLETFLRFQDWRLGRNNDDPLFSRNAFVSLASPYGTARVGRLQTFLFDTTARFNALGNSPAFSPALRHVFGSGNLEGVQGDFYWNRAISYSTPNFDGITGNLMYSQGDNSARGDRYAASLVVAKGLFAGALSAQRVHRDDGIDDLLSENAWQLGATYNFGFARVFGLYTRTRDKGLDVRSHLATAGVAVPVGPGTLQAQYGRAQADGPAVDRRHGTASAAYLYPYDSVTDIYLIGMDDRVRGQTRGLSVAVGVRYRF